MSRKVGEFDSAQAARTVAHGWQTDPLRLNHRFHRDTDCLCPKGASREVEG